MMIEIQEQTKDPPTRIFNSWLDNNALSVIEFYDLAYCIIL